MIDQPAPLGLHPSFGFGDRLGLATPGHVDALRKAGGAIKGIFAQQSIREMTRTRRSPQEVMDSARRSLKTEGFGDVWGADADHLKTPADVDRTVDAGFTFFTIDPSDHVDSQADSYDHATLEAKFALVRSETSWISAYEGRSVAIPQGPVIRFDALTVRRAAVKYGRAIRQALALAHHIRETAAQCKLDYEIELSVDETPQPTTLAEHYIIAEQCRKADLKLVSLAPRYIGDFEKGVDYKGDVQALEHSLRAHAAIARHLGPYKLSLHSGSDKLSMYQAFAQATGGLFHVKTAGTSYLEALRVVAQHDQALFRTIIDFARQRYDVDKATYHVSAQVTDVPPPHQVADVQALERIYLQCWPDVPLGQGFANPGRQILHCTFGSVLGDEQLGPALRGVLESEPVTYRQILSEHFSRHLEMLVRGMA